MNAPAAATALAKPSLHMIALADLVPSNTHIQQMRRARFDKKLISELAESIKSVGVLQPILVRPLDGEGNKALEKLGRKVYQIVAGERRFLAAKQAGLAEIAANVRELTDDQVLEVQLIENLQREGLHELEEAEGYEELMKLKKINADQVAAMVGKSRSYVYARIKLLALAPEARKAFYAGDLDASKALLVARISHHDTQRHALKEISGRHGHPMSYREAHDFILRNYMLRLKEARFDITDATLIPKAGACGPCPKRTGNQADLFGDVKDADVCTDPKCFEEKRQKHVDVVADRHKSGGKKLIHGADAKKIFPQWERGSDYMQGGYHLLGDTTWASGQNRKVADLLGKDFEPTLIQHPFTGQVHKVATQQQVAAAVNKNRSKAKQPGQPSRSAAPATRNSAGDFDLREKVALRIGEELAKKHPGTLGRTELLYLVEREHEAWDSADDSLYKAFKLPTSGRANLSKLTDKDLVRFAIAGAVTDHIFTGWGDGKKFAAAICKRFKLDPAKITKELQDESKKVAAAKSGKPTWSTKILPATGSKNFMAPMLPSDQLAVVIGDKPLQRTEITKKIWGHIKKHALQDKKNPRLINADAPLLPIFGGKKQVSMFEMTKLVSKHLRATSTPAKASKKKPSKKAKGKKK